MNKIYEYPVQVTRTQIFTVDDTLLNQERQFQKGKADRKSGNPCASSDGAYLEGWYHPDTAHYYIDPEAAHLL